MNTRKKRGGCATCGCQNGGGRRGKKNRRSKTRTKKGGELWEVDPSRKDDFYTTLVFGQQCSRSKSDDKDVRCGSFFRGDGTCWTEDAQLRCMKEGGCHTPASVAAGGKVLANYEDVVRARGCAKTLANQGFVSVDRDDGRVGGKCISVKKIPQTRQEAAEVRGDKDGLCQMDLNNAKFRTLSYGLIQGGGSRKSGAPRKVVIGPRVHAA